MNPPPPKALVFAFVYSSTWLCGFHVHFHLNRARLAWGQFMFGDKNMQIDERTTLTWAHCDEQGR